VHRTGGKGELDADLLGQRDDVEDQGMLRLHLRGVGGDAEVAQHVDVDRGGAEAREADVDVVGSVVGCSRTTARRRVTKASSFSRGVS
jgi:hypothetical protein